MTVFIPTPLVSYTKNRRQVTANGGTLGEVLLDLDRQFPGIRFRMIDEQDGVRQHIRFFINGDAAMKLDAALMPRDELQIICAISGGAGACWGSSPTKQFVPA
ncbi:MAG: MoaD/ThiS family protein [Candidatus Solibacter usitatus]|nr:MoaD/ThiS family protein [Candidatus Solibacter usitatus]